MVHLDLPNNRPQVIRVRNNTSSTPREHLRDVYSVPSIPFLDMSALPLKTIIVKVADDTCLVGLNVDREEVETVGSFQVPHIPANKSHRGEGKYPKTLKSITMKC